MRKRLREKYTDEELAVIYSTPHEHHHWRDHIIRVEETIKVAKTLKNIKSAADLSAGDAHIINSLGIDETHIGDFAPKYDYVGPIEKTIKDIPFVDLFICSETIEHLDDPLSVLKAIRKKTRILLLTTPEGKFDDTNPEHYWAWDNDGVLELLEQAGFKPILYKKLSLSQEYYYDYQIWVCE